MYNNISRSFIPYHYKENSNKTKNIETFFHDTNTASILVIPLNNLFHVEKHGYFQANTVHASTNDSQHYFVCI